MKLIGKLIGTVFALVVTIFMVQGIASETGEVVVLTTVEQASGDTATTRLWVVEHDNTLWLRGSAQSGWTQRALSQNIPLQLERDGITNTYTVTSAPAQVGIVNELMRQKYGWRDQFISLMAPREASVVLRLTAVS
ncbi:MAG: hypothetical protein VXY02_08930 [Pseudomonadota bacterium]|nr:hypothetical protein [Pseudomonadota bacterium]